MKSVIWSVAVVAALVAGPVNAGTMAPRQAAAKSSDKALDESIENKIKAYSSLKNYDIDVDVSDGVATLTGTVATEAERAKASQLANVSGVSRVDNRIIVDLGAASKGTAGTLKDKTKEGAEKTRETAKEGAEKTKSGAQKVGEKTKSGAEKVGEKTKEGASKTGEAVTDGYITTRVKSRFVGEDLLKDSDINVDTDNHVVTLKGTVASAAGRAKAISIAKNTEGVRRVVDQLTVGPKSKS